MRWTTLWLVTCLAIGFAAPAFAEDADSAKTDMATATSSESTPPVDTQPPADAEPKADAKAKADSEEASH